MNKTSGTINIPAIDLNSNTPIANLTYTPYAVPRTEFDGVNNSVPPRRYVTFETNQSVSGTGFSVSMNSAGTSYKDSTSGTSSMMNCSYKDGTSSGLTNEELLIDMIKNGFEGTLAEGGVQFKMKFHPFSSDDSAPTVTNNPFLYAYAASNPQLFEYTININSSGITVSKPAGGELGFGVARSDNIIMLPLLFEYTRN